MKSIKILFILVFVSITLCANNLKNDKEVLNNIYKNIILKDLDKTQIAITSLQANLKDMNIDKSKESFKKLVNAWKSVETLYILGDLNEDYIDIPRYIDIFHNGNEDIKIQLDRVIASNDEPRIALYKNSLKSINALEYILFRKDINNTRVNNIAITILNRISTHIENIKLEYIAQEQTYLSDIKKANAITINAIIQNSYKLKEWRVGDVIGLSKKYKNNPDNKRAEYYQSKSSVLAIQAILDTYKRVLDNKDFVDYGDYLISLTDGKEMKKLRISLNKAIELVKEIRNNELKNNKELYEAINTIHVILFVEMLEELSINAKILDADGD